MKLKLDDDDRLAFVAARGQGIDAGDRVDPFLDLLGDLALDDLRRGARVFGGDHDHGEVDVRELVVEVVPVQQQAVKDEIKAAMQEAGVL